MLHLTDLRQILHYVPSFRDRTFLIALDGAVVDNENFGNLLLDIALLRSLRIGVALVHGAGHQIAQLAAREGISPSNADGTGVTDAGTLRIAITAATRLTHTILEGLAANDLRGAAGNALVAHPAGILQGVDHKFTGRLERVDTQLLDGLLANDIIPVIQPLGIDGEGKTWRLNSDAVAVEVAKALKAVKLIYLCDGPGIVRDGELYRHLSADEAEAVLKKHRGEMASGASSKLEHAIRAARGGVPRVHVIDGRVEEGLLAEVFSNEGIGTLIHTNEYQAIRRAHRKDTRALYGLLKAGMEAEELMRRSLGELQRQVEDYYLFEVDRSPAGCVAVHFYPEEGKAELASIYVDPKLENQGIGVKLMQYAEAQARAGGAKELFCLSTQAFNYFVQKGGFKMGTPDDLPASRRERYERSGRRSQVLTKKL